MESVFVVVGVVLFCIVVARLVRWYQNRDRGDRGDRGGTVSGEWFIGDPRMMRDAARLARAIEWRMESERRRAVGDWEGAARCEAEAQRLENFVE